MSVDFQILEVSERRKLRIQLQVCYSRKQSYLGMAVLICPSWAGDIVQLAECSPRMQEVLLLESHKPPTCDPSTQETRRRRENQKVRLILGYREVSRFPVYPTHTFKYILPLSMSKQIFLFLIYFILCVQVF